MSAASLIEPCPLCQESSAVRPKLLLIGEAWIPAPGKDARLEFFADLGADDIRPEYIKAPPLEQFVDGYFCERCGKGFTSEAVLREDRRRYP